LGYIPHPKSLFQKERGALNPDPLLLKKEKGLGDKGKLAKLGYSQTILTLGIL
jgi:hypothetical protein